jgi:chromosome partitioning protein
MRTIVVASQKGGVGKTTIAGHLGVMAEQNNDGPVALIDTDPQGSLASWWNERINEVPLFAQVEISKLEAHLHALENGGIKLAIIDTPPSVTEMIQQVLRNADLVLIPTRPSPHDLRAVGSTVDLVENAGKRMIFIINGAASRARIAGCRSAFSARYGGASDALSTH